MTPVATVPPDAARFRDPSWMAAGSPDQRWAWAVLAGHRLLHRLAPLPVRLAGTFPLDIAVQGSDLDLLVEARDLAALELRLDREFGAEEGFRRHRGQFADGPAVVAGFTCDGLAVEIFAQAVDVEAQAAWRHMLAEARLLALAGPAAREAIRALKAAGLKTEPAFARLFALPGDPYRTLLDLADADPAELAGIVARWRETRA